MCLQFHPDKRYNKWVNIDPFMTEREMCMPHIKVQKLVENENGTGYKSGSAALIDTVYDPNYPGKSKHVTREALGKVIWLAENRRSGIFRSASRGLVLYDADIDQFFPVEKTDPRVKELDWYHELRIHTTFGDAYLLLQFLLHSDILPVLRNAFPTEFDYEKVLAHTMYGVINGEDHGHCDDFMDQSFASYLFSEIPVGSLGSDSSYYEAMGDDTVKVRFFKAFVAEMRKTHPSFGKACYVDSTPLPGDAKNNPYNALCSHGTGECCDQTRLALILDSDTGLPVWFTVISGNLQDKSTISTIQEDVKTSIGVEIESMVLDAGYAITALFERYNINTYEPTEDGNGANYVIVRMPDFKGYPYKELYQMVKPSIENPNDEFDRESHTYYGHMYQMDVLGYPQYCYVYVDKDNALELRRKWKRDHAEEYENLSYEMKEWYRVKFGFFILISGKKLTVQQMLDEYFGRTDIECYFKSAKEYLDILPIAKWTKKRVLGKILSDSIRAIVYFMFRKEAIKSGVVLKNIFLRCQSLDCMLKGGEQVIVYTPVKQVREYYQLFGFQIPAAVSLLEIKKQLNDGKKLTLSTASPKRRGRPKKSA